MNPRPLLLLLVAVPAAITLTGRRAGNPKRTAGSASRSWESSPANERDPRVEPMDSPPPEHHNGGRVVRASVPLGEDDWEVMSEICFALGSQQIAWLRSNDFHTPWLACRVRPAVDIEPLVVRLLDRPFAADIPDALLILAEAIEAFVGFYSPNTFSDPLLRDAEWQFFDWEDPDAAKESTASAEKWYARAARLQHLSAELRFH